MANLIKIKRSNVHNKVPELNQLELGELAVNTYDGKLFLKKNDGQESIVQLGQFGYTGSTGYTGSQGDVGFVGSRGNTGFTGSQGDQGTIGFTGSQGVAGFTGSQGTQGDLGYTGSKGNLGDIGYTGSQGAQGDLGYSGSKGDIGFAGSQGLIGYTGSLGYIGSTGASAGLSYQFSTTTTSGTSSGFVRYNSTVISSVTNLFINKNTYSSLNLSNYITTWDDSTNTFKGYLTVNNLDHSVANVFRIKTVTFVPTNFSDESASSVSLTGTGTYEFSSDVPSGGPDSSLYFPLNSTGNRVVVGPDADLDTIGTGDFTVECWFKVPSGTTQTNFATIFNTASNVFALQTNFSGTAGFHCRFNSGSPNLNYNASIVDGNWHHIAVTRSGTTLTLWCDGVSQDTDTSSASVNFGSSSASWIGAGTNGASDNPFKGYVYKLRISDVARYSAGFTPSSTYGTDGDTIFLLKNGDADSEATINVDYISGSLPANNERIYLNFSRTGDLGYSGSVGFAGSRGFTGSIGFTGSQGNIGFTGSQGAQGNIGYTGSKGDQGDIGYTGSQGSQGGVGFTGSKGDQGVIGFTGSQGSQGDIGFTGSQGSQGNIGFTGSQGNIGFTGSQGSQGNIGFTGSQGSQGNVGFTGSQGSQGDIGYTGSVGFTGSQSTVPGFTGSQGNLGYTGSAGGGSSYVADVGNGSATSITVTHNLNNANVLVVVRENSSGYYVYPDIKYSTVNAVILEFVDAPTSNQYKVIVVGV